MMCPFGVIGRERKGRHVAVKCDRCPDREIPACVSSCPTHALELLEVESFTKEQRQAAALSISAGG